MPKKRWLPLVIVLVVVALLVGTYFIYENLLREVPIYATSGQIGEVTEETLTERLAPEMEILDQKGIRYKLWYDDTDSSSNNEADLWIVVAAKDIDRALNEISMALYGEPSKREYKAG